MAFRNEPAGGIDATFAIDRGFSVHPILCAFPVLRFSQNFCAERSHDRETIVDFGDLYILRLDSRHLVSGFHGLDRARGTQHIAAGLS